MATSPRTLSALEVSILRALAEGLQSKEIALHVRRSKPTIEGYVRQLYIKFDARTRAQLVARAISRGTLHPKKPFEWSQGENNSAATFPSASTPKT